MLVDGHCYARKWALLNPAARNHIMREIRDAPFASLCFPFTLLRTDKHQHAT